MSGASKAPTRKVTAGAVGSGAIGVPMAIIIAWMLSTQGVIMPPEVTAALGGVITGLSGFVASYITWET
jgi:hypothetical protein